MGGVRHAGPSEPPRVKPVRLAIAFLGFFALALLIAWRLVDLQVVHHEHYLERARQQSTNKRVLHPERGLILDRRGNELVTNVPNYWAVGVRPSALPRLEVAARKLAPILGRDGGALLRELKSASSFFWLERRLDPARAAQLRAENLPGVVMEQVTLRRYPYGHVGAQVIGHVDVDNRGLEGIEGKYDGLLAGKPGWEILGRDAFRHSIEEPQTPRQDAVDGGQVVLSIDIDAQTIAERELLGAVEEHKASAGMIVVTRPATGEVLAMASVPGYDPNRPGETGPASKRNRTITDVYEPGSTFKVVPFAGVLEHQFADIDELIWCENGSWSVHNRRIRDAHSYGWLTARQVLEKSSNIGTAKLTQRLGQRRFYTLMRDFGFGQETGVDLVGEVRGILPPPGDWSGVSLENMAMGQGVAVTALQLAMAYGAIANGGLLMEPILILSTTDSDGEMALSEPTVRRRTLTPKTARMMRKLLTDAVELGTGRNAIIEGLEVAGKTGTSQKVDVERKTYYQDRYVSSFAGFLSAENPELLCVVVIDDPRGAHHYGGSVAAPVFRRVMEQLLLVLPRQRPQKRERAGSDQFVLQGPRGVEVPVLVSLRRDEAWNLLDALGLEARFQGEGNLVCTQQVPPGSRVQLGTSVDLVLTEPEQTAGQVSVPDVRGMPLRSAVASITRTGLKPTVRGSGIVVSQSPAPGSRQERGSRCSVVAREKGRGA